MPPFYFQQTIRQPSVLSSTHTHTHTHTPHQAVHSSHPDSMAEPTWVLEAEEAEQETASLVGDLRASLSDICAAAAACAEGDAVEGPEGDAAHETALVQISAATRRAATATSALQRVIHNMKERYAFGDVLRLVACRKRATAATEALIASAVPKDAAPSSAEATPAGDLRDVLLFRESAAAACIERGRAQKKRRRRSAEEEARALATPTWVAALDKADDTLACLLEHAARVASGETGAAKEAAQCLETLGTLLGDASSGLPRAAGLGFRADELSFLDTFRASAAKRVRVIEKL